MRKMMKLMALSAIVALGFTSCGDKEKDPTIPEITLKNAITEVNGNYEADFKVTCAETGKLNSISATCFYNNLASSTAVEKNNIVISKVSDQSWNVTIAFPKSISGLNVEFLDVYALTNDDGNSMKRFAAPSTSPEPPADEQLGSASDFEWKREGGKAGTGDLSVFGLKWTSNGAKANYAYIDKDGASKMVKLYSNTWAGAWASITTAKALSEAVEAGTDITRFKEIGVDATANLNYVLGVKNGDTYYMIHITKATIATDPQQGTTVTVIGQYKK